MNEKNVTAEEILYLIDADNLRTWASYSLEWRCTLFHRKFPDRWINRYVLGRLYRDFGVKKKQVVIKRAP